MRNTMGTASVELAGRAEEATAATLEALEPRSYGQAVRRRKTSRQGEAGREVETLVREGERELDALLPEGRRKSVVLSRQGEQEVDDRCHRGAQTRADSNPN